MKKYIIIISSILAFLLAADFVYYHLGVYIPFFEYSEAEVSVKTDGKTVLLEQDGNFAPFEIKGVDLGAGFPGEWSTDFAIDKQTYMRWFSMIQDMGANTVRIYTIQSQPFYDAFYEYNKDREEPLYLLHGVWVNDHTMNSYKDAYHKDFYETFTQDCKAMVDIIHGNRKLRAGSRSSAGHGSYMKDISPWVIGYILGVEWEDLVVAYTDNKYRDDSEIRNYSGRYFYTAPGASAFEAMLTRVADRVTEYETKRYGHQRLMAFANWPTTDPFNYASLDRAVAKKCAAVDVEHILSTENFRSGQFASYHVYPYFPDYMSYISDWSEYGLDEAQFVNENGALNTYAAYLSMLVQHHSMPVVITEFGIPTSRAMAHIDVNTGRNQGAMNEAEAGQALAECYKDIKNAGCAGSCIFAWQDEWFKRTWNTLHSVDLRRNPYWSDYQTNEQFFGILTFDPGEEKSICYVDGDISEWNDTEKIAETDEGDVSVMYDEKFMYFLVHKKDLDFENEKIYIPLDITPKSGSTYCENYDLKFEREADFLMIFDGKDNSRVMVQNRYEALRSTYSKEIYKFDTYAQGYIPSKTSPVFKNIDLILHKRATVTARSDEVLDMTTETGKLLMGNANPDSADFNSKADFAVNGDYIEVRLPWQLLNFADPSRMNIHDDYYDSNFGIDYLEIDEMYVGIGSGNYVGRIPMGRLELEGWGNNVTFHERLKQSYYVIRELWNEE